MQRVLAFIVVLLSACATDNSASVPPLPAEPLAAEPARYRIQAGDELELRFFANPELDETVVVPPDGRIGLPLLDAPVLAAGRTPEEFEQALEAQYGSQLRDPDIDVVVRGTIGHMVYVGGEVAKPGMFPMTPGLTVLGAIVQAGGFNENASEREVLVIRKTDQGRPASFRVGAETRHRAAAELAAAQLVPTDVVYVPRSRVANANRFVEQYIRGLLMFDGFRISFGYDLDDPEDR